MSSRAVPGSPKVFPELLGNRMRIPLGQVVDYERRSTAITSPSRTCRATTSPV